jgi:hypothetical protein
MNGGAPDLLYTAYRHSPEPVSSLAVHVSRTPTPSVTVASGEPGGEGAPESTRSDLVTTGDSVSPPRFTHQADNECSPSGAVGMGLRMCAVTEAVVATPPSQLQLTTPSCVEESVTSGATEYHPDAPGIVGSVSMDVVGARARAAPGTPATSNEAQHTANVIVRHRERVQRFVGTSSDGHSLRFVGWKDATVP